MSNQKIAVILFNLGGPDKQEAVRPFLINLFSDPNILRAPKLIRWILARFIAWRRTAAAQEIYAKIGGGSPIVRETGKQAIALQQLLQSEGLAGVRCFTAMRYWHPRLSDIIQEIQSFNPDEIVLLPLYPQYSTTTTRSSYQEWRAELADCKISADVHEICCYPEQPDFIAAHAALIMAQASRYFGPGAREKARLLFSAHGLPQRIVDAGDPYPQQVARTARAIAVKMGLRDEDWEICYQSRVGPLKWLGPSTEDCLRASGRAGAAVVVVPIAFVSEHSETLVELDMEYRHLAERAGVRDYIRISALGVQADFIRGLARLTGDALPVSRLCMGGETPCLMD